MSLEKNKALMRHFYAAVVAGDLAAIMAMSDADVLDHNAVAAGQPRGRDGLLWHVQGLRAAFPDLTITVEELVAEDERVVGFWTASGTHQGPFGGMPATGKRLTWLVIDRARIRDGRLTEYWARTDRLLLRQQMGATITPPAAAPTASESRSAER